MILSIVLFGMMCSSKDPEGSVGLLSDEVNETVSSFEACGAICGLHEVSTAAHLTDDLGDVSSVSSVDALTVPHDVGYVLEFVHGQLD